MSTSKILIATALALWLGARAAAAAADSGMVLVHGGAGERERATVTAAIEAVTRAAGWALADKPLAQRDLEALTTCADSKQPWACMPPAQRELRRVFVVSVERRTSGGVPMIVLTGKAVVPSERVIVVGERYCESCAEAQLGAASAELANRLLRELAVRAGRTTVAVRSRPRGAQIILDGERVGATDATLSTYPGLHSVVLEKPGFAVAARSFLVEEGQPAEVALELQPIAAPDPPRRPPHRPPSRRPPALVIGSGAALLVAGIVLVAVDEDVHLTGKQPAHYLDTAPLGVGLAITGVVAAGAGAWWWMRRTRARGAPAVAVDARGAVVGLAGAF